MGFIENRERLILKNEKNDAKAYLDSEKIIFARNLNNGLGEEIIKEINNPTKPNKMLGVTFKIKRWFKIFSERLNNLKINQ